MDILELVKTRRTIKKFKTDPISEDIMNMILESAIWAPSHANSQPWEFIVLGKETMQKLVTPFQQILERGPLANPNMPEARKQELREFAKDFGRAPVMVAALSKPPLNPLQKAENPMAVSAAIQNMSLVAWDKGVGSIWLSMGSNPEVRGILGVKEGYEIVGIIALGYPEIVPMAPPRDSYKNRVTYLP